MKMKKYVVVFILLQVLPLMAQQKNSGTILLPDLVKPRYISADSQRVYIINNYRTVTGYSIQTFKKNLEITASKGNGPAEFVNVPMVKTYGAHIILKTTEKIAYYSNNGKYLKEKRLKRESVIEPLKDNFLLYYLGFSKEGRQMFWLVDVLDSNFVKLKNIYKYKAPKMNYIISGGDGSQRGKYDLIRENFSTTVWENRAFIADPSRGFYILICDQNGKTLHEIIKNVPKVAITEKDREILISKAKADCDGSDEYWKTMLKSNDLYCPEFFPVFERITVANDTIYVKTFQSQGDKKMFILLDFQGNERSRVYLPQSYYWAIRDNRYYFLSYSDENDEWSLNWVTIQI